MDSTVLRTGASLAIWVGVACPGHAAQPVPCDALLGSFIEGARITTAQLNPASATLPAHCEVLGAINERTGADGQRYAIKFHLRLPTAWNQRFFYSGGGGTDGNLGNADAPQLGQGYAVVSTDSGHDNATNTSALASSFQFAFDPQARSDYGYNGPARVTNAAKAITERFYGKKPKYAYFQGCSEGGREGLMLSQRYPTLFDGIVSGNPGMDLPKAAVAEAWDSQAFAAAARASTPFGNPDLATAFTNDELAIVGDAILEQCDAQDGLVDGMVFNPQACHFDPATLGPAGTGKLSHAQVGALEKVFDGARNSRGKALYAGWYWDPGIAAGGWRVWKLGPLIPTLPGNTSLNLTLGGGALPFIFTTPPNTTTGGTPGHPGTVITTSGPIPGLRRRRRRLRAVGAELQLRHRRAENLRQQRRIPRIGNGLHGHRRHRLPALQARGQQADHLLGPGRSGVLHQVPRALLSPAGGRQRRAARRAEVRPPVRGSGHEPLRRRPVHLAVRRLCGAGAVGRARQGAGQPAGHCAGRHAVAGPHPPAVRVAGAGALQGPRQHRGCGQLLLRGTARRRRSPSPRPPPWRPRR
jgi:hypothetical protein